MTTSASPKLETQALRILESVFGYESFRGKQAEITIVPALAPDQQVKLALSLDGFTASYGKVSVVDQ